MEVIITDLRTYFFVVLRYRNIIVNAHGNLKIDLDFKMAICRVYKVDLKNEDLLRMSAFWRITKWISMLKTLFQIKKN